MTTSVEERLRLVERARDNMRARMQDAERRLRAALARCACERSPKCEACQSDRDFLSLPRVPDDIPDDVAPE